MCSSLPPPRLPTIPWCVRKRVTITFLLSNTYFMLALCPGLLLALYKLHTHWILTVALGGEKGYLTDEETEAQVVLWLAGSKMQSWDTDASSVARGPAPHHASMASAHLHLIMEETAIQRHSVIVPSCTSSVLLHLVLSYCSIYAPAPAHKEHTSHIRKVLGRAELQENEIQI